MDPFTAAIGPLFTAVAGAVLAWIVIRGRDAAKKVQPPRTNPDARRERLYRHSFESSPVGLAVMTPQGQWVRVNDRMRAMLGYSKTEMARLTIRELTHSDDRKLEATHIRKLMRKEIGSYSLQKRLLCKDREYRRFEVSMVRFEEESGVQDLWQCVLNPVLTAAPVETSSDGRSLGRFLEPISDLAYVSYDDQGIIEEWNEGATRIFGYERSEMIGRSRTSLYRDSDVWEQRPLNDLKDAVANGRFESDATRVGRDGVEIRLRVTIIPDVIDEHVSGFMELAREIEQVRGVDQYRQAYERLKNISEEKIQSLHTEHGGLRDEVDRLREKNTSLTADLTRAKQGAQKQLAELRILTDAFRKELENRRSLEHELKEALAERDQLDHRMNELESRRPLLETEFVELASPGEAHWVNIEIGRPEEMLLELAEDRRTGALVATRHSSEKRIFFENGQIYSSTSNDPATFLGEVLLRSGTISSEDHQRALEIHQETGIALGRILVLTGKLDEETLTRTMTSKTRNDVFGFLEWSEGQMMFVDGDAGSTQLVPVRLDVYSMIDERLDSTIPIGSLAFDPDDTVEAAADGVSPIEPEPIEKAEGAVEESVVEPAEEPAEEAEGEPSEQSAAEPAEVKAGAGGPGEEIEIRYIASASKRSTKFHLIDCKAAKKIEQGNRLEFRTDAEALEKGLEPCRKCIG